MTGSERRDEKGREGMKGGGIMRGSRGDDVRVWGVGEVRVRVRVRETWCA